MENSGPSHNKKRKQNCNGGRKKNKRVVFKKKWLLPVGKKSFTFNAQLASNISIDPNINVTPGVLPRPVDTGKLYKIGDNGRAVNVRDRAKMLLDETRSDNRSDNNLMNIDGSAQTDGEQDEASTAISKWIGNGKIKEITYNVENSGPDDVVSILSIIVEKNAECGMECDGPSSSTDNAVGQPKKQTVKIAIKRQYSGKMYKGCLKTKLLSKKGIYMKIFGRRDAVPDVAWERFIQGLELSNLQIQEARQAKKEDDEKKDSTPKESDNDN